MKTRAGTGPSAAAIIAALCCGRCSICRRAERRGAGRVHCPVATHDDRVPSLNVDVREQTTLVHCHGGCPQDAVLDALRLRGVWPGRSGDRAPGTSPPGSDSEPQRWTYETAGGEVLAYHRRRNGPDGGKVTMWWELPNGRPSKGTISPTHLPLYPLRAFLAADPAATVLLVEGEHCADAAWEHGFVAVSLAGGAGQVEFGTALDALRGRQVVLIPDHDAAGHELMRRVVDALAGVAASVQWLDLPGVGHKGDIVDYFALGHMPGELTALLLSAEEAAKHNTGGACRFCEQSSSTQASGLSGPLAAVPPFPRTALPEPARSYVHEAAEALGCPVDFVAAPFLACAGAAMGDGVAIAPKPDFRLYPILWVAVIGEPGTIKSPALRMAAYPLTMLQQAAYDAYRERLAAYQLELAEWQSKTKADRGTPPKEPVLEHFLTSDATLEALATMIEPPLAEDNDGSLTTGVCWTADELAGWVLGNNQYKGGRGSDRQRWLTSWAGSALKVDRVKRTIFITDPVIAVAGCVQPDVLAALRNEDDRRDGFEERPLYCWPDTSVGQWTERSVAPETRTRIVAVFRDLRRELRQTASVALSTPAKRLWVSWFNENRRLAAQERGILAGVYSKLDVQAARLALILHALALPESYECEPVSAETMVGAIELAEYFRAHAHRALSRFGVSHNGRAGGLVARLYSILRSNSGAWLSRTALNDATDRNFSAADRDAALAQLAADGLAVRRMSAPGERGGRPSEEWRAVEPIEAQERGNVQTVQPVGSDVSTFPRMEDTPQHACQFCGCVLTGVSDACFQCNERPCADCGGATGSALRRFCMRCALGGSNEAIEGA